MRRVALTTDVFLRFSCSHLGDRAKTAAVKVLMLTSVRAPTVDGHQINPVEPIVK